MSANGCAVDVELAGKVVDGGAGLIGSDELVYFVWSELPGDADGLRSCSPTLGGRGWPGLGELQETPNLMGAV